MIHAVYQEPHQPLPSPRTQTNFIAEEPTSYPEQSPQTPTLPGLATVLANTTPMAQANQSQDTPLQPTQATPKGTKRTLSDLDANPRKLGRRLTTKEEVALFNICNQHAPTFGKRSDICNWWRTVADEFARSHGRPYSWHSVRRNVENLTKQRVKFLEGQRAGGSTASLTQDSMNPAWCAVLDIWIPTWQRWAEAEAERIAKRDEMARRRSVAREDQRVLGARDVVRRTPSASPMSDLMVKRLLFDEAFDEAFEDDESVGDDEPPAKSTAAHKVGHVGEPSPSTSTPGVKLPPGFETMFTSHHSTSQASPSAQAQAQASMPYAFLPSTQVFAQVTDSTRIPAPNTAARPQPVVPPPDQPVFESSVPGFQGASQDLGSADIVRVKEELRREMRAEWRLEMERSRVALEEKLDSVQKTQEMILEMLRQGRT